MTTSPAAKRANAGTRVVIAMSGGVDSSVAAALLVEQGYDVIGLMLRLWSDAPGGDARGGHNKCCAPDAIIEARAIAGQLAIPFHVVDAQQIFREQVVQFFLDGYSAGTTPNPCLECNRYIRWTFLLNEALSLGAQYLATGHFARVQRQPASWQLLRGTDAAKDQSYVLSVLNQQQLAHAMFPVGAYTKAEVRELARGFGLPVHSRRDSQDLCFVPDGDYRPFLQAHVPDALRPGAITDSAGRQVGMHAGLPLYTIGQRKGLRLAGPEAQYVVAMDAAANTLRVGPRSALESTRLRAERVNWVSGVVPATAFDAQVQIRAHGTPAAARIIPEGSDEVSVEFEAAVQSATPGQAAVFYAGMEILGGGVIAS
ncbi:MAG: tRNA 2-thiouridine(34) synthase MnmA [Chloroflexi bacterium]|nr:MAG: tRNA 2-thiouridine(34) synthase MnmA [Chloroflexota bacterium]